MRVLLFNDKNFPGYCAVWKCKNSKTVTAGELKNALKEKWDVFISAHGKYFPLEAAEEFISCLETGCGWIHLGGVPLETPCIYAADQKKWIVLNDTFSFFRKLNIHTYLKVHATENSKFREKNCNIPKELIRMIDKDDGKNLIFHPTKDKYDKEDWGSVGSVDVNISSVLDGIGKEGYAEVSYGILLEYLAGVYEGARWMIFPSRFLLSEKQEVDLTDLAAYVSAGTRKVWMETTFASYEEGECPQFVIRTDCRKKECSWSGMWKLSGEGGVKQEKEIEILAGEKVHRFSISKPQRSGYYQADLTLTSSDGEKIFCTQGFWIYDRTVFDKQSQIRCGNRYFLFDGKPELFAGTTYMAGDVSRNFLLYPNPSIWLADMQNMKKEGIRWLRTGLWCNWRRYMLDAGRMDESILRALDAFLQCAARCGIHVTFTFFSFVPEAWQGTNPYLDPRSVQAQSFFIRTIVSRYKGLKGVDWDLINEPYVENHPTRPISFGEAHQQAYFQKYMKKKYGSYEKLWEHMDCGLIKNMSVSADDFSGLSIPEEKKVNFGYMDMGNEQNGSLWLDYKLCANEIFKDWTEKMKLLIKQETDGQLVTVGQDEAVFGQRPIPLTFGDVVDYNCQHPWWHNNALYFSIKSSHLFGKPLLVQEMGVMYNQTASCWPRRTEEEISQLIGKKYVYSYANQAGGVLQWIWNTNFVLDSANESHIGAIRCDGSCKPEFTYYRKLNSFFKKFRQEVTDSGEKYEVAVLFPISNLYSNQSLTVQALISLTGILGYELHKDFLFVSEADCEILEKKNDLKMLIVPSPINLCSRAFESALKFAEQGKTVIFNGPFSLDEHFKKTARMEKLIGKTAIRNISSYENIQIDGRNYSFFFGREMIEMLQTEVPEKRLESGFADDGFFRISVGKGRLCFCKVPIDYAENQETLTEYYKKMLEIAGVNPDFEIFSSGNRGCQRNDIKGIFIGKCRFDEADLFLMVNENSCEANVTFKDVESGNSYRMHIEENGIFMFTAKRNTGDILAVYDDANIEVTKA